jgi:hypothetical protein
METANTQASLSCHIFDGDLFVEIFENVTTDCLRADGIPV